MIRSVLNINNYWKVIVYFNIDYNFFNLIEDELYYLDSSDYLINKVYNNMKYNNAKAVTISIYKYRTSIVLFNEHNSYYDYINSIIHESEHIKQHILNYYKIDDVDEEPAYTIGYIASKLIKIFNLKVI